jgi:hypothetical protein
MSSKPGAPNAESAGGSDAVPLTVIRQFVDEGFRYIGRIRLAHDLGPAPAPAAEQPEPERDGDGGWRAKVVRCTADGDLYVGR